MQGPTWGRRQGAGFCPRCPWGLVLPTLLCLQSSPIRLLSQKLPAAAGTGLAAHRASQMRRRGHHRGPAAVSLLSGGTLRGWAFSSSAEGPRGSPRRRELSRDGLPPTPGPPPASGSPLGSAGECSPDTHPELRAQLRLPPSSPRGRPAGPPQPGSPPPWPLLPPQTSPWSGGTRPTAAGQEGRAAPRPLSAAMDAGVT